MMADSESAVSPNATKAAAATLATREFLTNDFLLSASASSFISSGERTTAATSSTFDAGGGGGWNGVMSSGHRAFPSYEMSMFWTASSSRSISKNPLFLVVCGPMLRTNFAMLLENKLDAVLARRDGRSVYPMILTPLDVVTISLAWVCATLPPLAAAKSTQTEPGFMTLSISSLTKTGALRPGMRAVVMMMSTSLACSSIKFACAFL
mmetsp:Transcript_9984/g.28358  ORF Transcript_9984/g.28358 Transcript_9984/m.28358 type:complete len:208 (-) Transcript_9984:261-884(-)